MRGMPHEDLEEMSVEDLGSRNKSGTLPVSSPVVARSIQVAWMDLWKRVGSSSSSSSQESQN